MHKLASLAAAFGLALSAHAAEVGLKGIGYDSNLGQATVRLGLSEYGNLELGAGMRFDNSAATSSQKFSLGLSATFLGQLQHWNAVDNYFYGGLVFNKLPQANNSAQFALVAGLQPEITLMQHFAIGVRVGAEMQVSPDFQFYTTGDRLSVVDGIRFTLLF